MPSILSANFAQLGQDVAAVLAAGARRIHVDVMDGQFVPSIAMGPRVVEALAPQVHAADGQIEVHLMTDRPERHFAAFAAAGADGITFHVEATPHTRYTIDAIRATGCAVGAAICPGTPVPAVSELVESLDLVLCMTVSPGWRGQKFLSTSPAKLRRLRKRLSPITALEVDGGIDVETIGLCRDAGATHFVAGSAVFATHNPFAAYRQLAEIVQSDLSP